MKFFYRVQSNDSTGRGELDGEKVDCGSDVNSQQGSLPN
jgi:hypothetical protein